MGVQISNFQHNSNNFQTGRGEGVKNAPPPCKTNLKQFTLITVKKENRCKFRFTNFCLLLNILSIKLVYQQEIQEYLLKSSLMFNKQPHFMCEQLGNKMCLDGKYIRAYLRDQKIIVNDFLCCINLPLKGKFFLLFVFKECLQ